MVGKLIELSNFEGQQKKYTYFNIIPVQVLEVVIVLFDHLDTELYIGIIWGFRGEDFGLWRFRDAVPTKTQGLSFVQQTRVVLILIHHWMESKNCCRTEIAINQSYK